MVAAIRLKPDIDAAEEKMMEMFRKYLVHRRNLLSPSTKDGCRRDELTNHFRP
jgi:hypothetical protein